MAAERPSVAWIGSERVNRLPGAWSFIAIGALKAACNPSALAAAGVSHVVNAGAFSYERHTDVAYFDIEVLDSEEADLSRWFSPTSDFMDQARHGDGLVLVHCRAGRSRSAALVCAYLIEKGSLGVEEALELLRSTRAISQPNPAFMEQLQALAEDVRASGGGGGGGGGAADGSSEGALRGGGGEVGIWHVTQAGGHVGLGGLGGEGEGEGERKGKKREGPPALGQVVYCSRRGEVKRGTIVRVRGGGVQIEGGGVTYAGVQAWLNDAEYEGSNSSSDDSSGPPQNAYASKPDAESRREAREMPQLIWMGDDDDEEEEDGDAGAGGSAVGEYV